MLDNQQEIKIFHFTSDECSTQFRDIAIKKKTERETCHFLSQIAKNSPSYPLVT